MNIQTRKLQVIERVIRTRKTSLIHKIEKFLEEEDLWDTLSNAEKEAINEGLGQIEREETIPHEKVMKEIKGKYKLKG